MAVREKETSAYQKAEIAFLKEVRKRNGLTINEALAIKSEVPEIDFGTGIDAIDVVEKFVKLGFMEYHDDTGKFVAVNPEGPATEASSPTI